MIPLCDPEKHISPAPENIKETKLLLLLFPALDRTMRALIENSRIRIAGDGFGKQSGAFQSWESC